MDNTHEFTKIEKLAKKKKSAKIIKYLNNRDTEVVIAALKALSSIRDEDSVNRISSLLDDERPEIRREAALAMGSLGTEYAKTHLQHKMGKEQDETVRKAITEALQTLAAKKK